VVVRVGDVKPARARQRRREEADPLGGVQLAVRAAGHADLAVRAGRACLEAGAAAGVDVLPNASLKAPVAEANLEIRWLAASATLIVSSTPSAAMPIGKAKPVAALLVLPDWHEVATVQMSGLPKPVFTFLPMASLKPPSASKIWTRRPPVSVTATL